MGFRFIHAADLHLDTPFTGLTHLPSFLRNEIKESTFRAFDNLIQLCLDEDVDFLLISGDVFNSADRSLRAQLHFQKGIIRLAEQGILAYIVHGNHDPLDGYRASLDWPAQATFFSSHSVEAVPFYKNGKEEARIYGISYPTSHVADNLALGFKRDEGAPYAIGLLHANVGASSGHANYSPCTLTDLFNSRMDYWALGHVHTRQILKDKHPTIVYPGNIQGRSWKEMGPKGCYLVEVDDGKNTRLFFHPLDVIRWEEKIVDITPCSTEQDLLSKLEQLVGQSLLEAEGRSVILRFQLIGDSPLFKIVIKEGFIQDVLDYLRRVDHPFVWVQSIQSDAPRPLEDDPFFLEMHRWVQRLREDPAFLEELLTEAALPLRENHRLGRKWIPPARMLEVDWTKRIHRLLVLAERMKGGSRE